MAEDYSGWSDKKVWQTNEIGFGVFELLIGAGLIALGDWRDSSFVVVMGQALVVIGILQLIFRARR